jgi:hypothetical protein
MKLDRRRFLGSSVGVAGATGVAAEWVWPKHSVSYRRPRSAVVVLNAADYSERIEALLLDGLRLFRLQVLGRSVLLKPNLVEDLPGPVNTNSALIGAAARCFLRLGAPRVVIGEGPGHQRDTELVVQAAGLNLASQRLILQPDRMAFNFLRRLVRHLDRVELNTDIALIIHLTEFSKCFRARWDDNLAIPLIVVLDGSYHGRLDSRAQRGLQPGDQPSPGRQRHKFRAPFEHHRLAVARSLRGQPTRPTPSSNLLKTKRQRRHRNIRAHPQVLIPTERS